MEEHIGVFFGSRSPEHDVSIITAQLIIAGLKGLGKEVIPVYIDKEGYWKVGQELGDLSVFRDKSTDFSRRSSQKLFLDVEKSHGKLVFDREQFLGKEEISIDVVFPSFHGSYGEDGTIQGLFEMFDVPYVGCGVLASSVAMDKVLTKQFYLANAFPTTPFLSFITADWEKDRNAVYKKISQILHFPVFVKPVRLGSSIGIQRVKTSKDLGNALEVAFHYDDKVIVEESVEDLMDITCCVIGNTDPIPSKLQESIFQSSFFSFEEKYLKKGGAQLGKGKGSFVIPARISAKITKEIQSLACKIYKELGCSGIARIDFLYDTKKKKVFANEINPLPGTLYHHLWQASGIEFGTLLSKLLAYAYEKKKLKSTLTYTFPSTILSEVGGVKLGG